MANSIVSIGKLVEIDFDMKGTLQDIEKRLGSFDKKAPTIMKYAINKAAMEARKENAKQAKKRYKVADRSVLNASNLMKIARARAGNLTAELETSSNMYGYYKFQVKPRALAWTKDKPSMYRGQVLKSSGLNVMDGDGVENSGVPADVGSKGFITAFQSGHVAVVYRVRNKKAKNRPGPLNKHTQAIEESYSPGLMSMSARSFKEPSVQEKMFSAMEAEIDQRVMSVLKGG